MSLGRCSVDLVGEQRVGEDRAFTELEGSGARPVDTGADDVRRKQVRGELDTREARVERGSQCACHQGLRRARHTFKKDMTAAQDRDVEPVDDLELADHGSTHRLVQCAAQCSGVVHRCHSWHCALRARGITQLAHRSTGARRRRRRGRGGAARSLPACRRQARGHGRAGPRAPAPLARWSPRCLREGRVIEVPVHRRSRHRFCVLSSSAYSALLASRTRRGRMRAPMDRCASWMIPRARRAQCPPWHLRTTPLRCAPRCTRPWGEPSSVSCRSSTGSTSRSSAAVMSFLKVCRAPRRR